MAPELGWLSLPRASVSPSEEELVGEIFKMRAHAHTHTHTHRLKEKKTSNSFPHPQLLGEELGQGCSRHCPSLARGLSVPLSTIVDVLCMGHKHAPSSNSRERFVAPLISQVQWREPWISVPPWTPLHPGQRTPLLLPTASVSPLASGWEWRGRKTLPVAYSAKWS